MTRTFIIAGAVLAALGVALGAFGAHGLEATLTATGRADTFETASRYHMYHALGLVLIGLLADRLDARWTRWAGWLFVAGVVLFSGSLYVLAIFDLGIMGAIAPLGGTAFIAGWISVGVAAWQGERTALYAGMD
jgi:uncharacterized membrane protein YgdD (TMEM256/DUF423 family)